MPWIRSIPKPAGSRRSPIPKDLRRRSPSSSRRCTSTSLGRSRSGPAVPRNPVEGKPSQQDLLILKLDEGGSSAPELLGVPPTRGSTTTCKNQSDRASSASTPPAGALLKPTLCTRLDPSIPRPPAAGAADGGRGIERIDRKSTRLNSSHSGESRMPSSA